LFVLVASIAGMARGDDATTYAPPKRIELAIESVSPAGKIVVEGHNVSQKPLRLWRGSNSWGAACWHVLLVGHGRVDTWYQSPYQSFTRNFPAYDELAPQARTKRTLDLGDGTWLPLNSERFRGGAGDVVIVVYDVPSTDEAEKLGVWFGVAAAFTTLR
jgi:hypothetical protein